MGPAPGESFHLLRWIYAIPGRRNRANLAWLVEALRIGPFLSTPVRKLSLGQRMRGDLAAALLHDPLILFLDEPTIGLDVETRDALLGLTQHLNRERGVTVLLTTHDLTNLEIVSQRILLVEGGRLLFNDQLARPKGLFGQLRLVVVQYQGPVEGSPLFLPGGSATARGQTFEIELDIQQMPLRELLSLVDGNGRGRVNLRSFNRNDREEVLGDVDGGCGESNQGRVD